MKTTTNREIKKSFEEARALLEEIIATSERMLDNCNEILEDGADGYLANNNDNLKKIIDMLNNM